MKSYERVERMLREFGIERDLYSEDEEKKQTIRKMARSLDGGEAVSFKELAEEGVEDFAVFCQYKEDKEEEALEAIKEKILELIPEENENHTYYVVVLTDTFERKITAKQWGKNIRNAIKKKVKCNLSQINYQVLSYYSGDNQHFNIDIGRRMNVLSAPKGGEDTSSTIASKIGAYIYTAKLYDLVEMYNKVGDELFRRNVRYSIKDQLGVETSIKDTLENNPDNFWFLNNGITIVVQEKDALDLSKNSSVTLKYEKPEMISIINGAQTISTAAEFWYENNSDGGQEDKDAREARKEVKERARDRARVLLRIMYVADKKGEYQEELNEISVALNRQKPIKGEDIAYTSRAVLEINRLFRPEKKDDIHFCITKRGERIFGKYQYSLTDFARIVWAYRDGNPGDARTKSSNEVLKYFSKIGQDYVDEIKDKDEEEIFKKYFSPVNFAMQAYRYYKKADKKVKKSGQREEAVLRYGGYYFAAYLVYVLHNGNDYTEFPGSAAFLEQSEKEVYEVVKGYLELMNKVIEENKGSGAIIDSNTFKGSELYQNLIESKDKGASPKRQKMAKELEEEIRETLSGRA